MSSSSLGWPALQGHALWAGASAGCFVTWLALRHGRRGAWMRALPWGTLLAALVLGPLLTTGEPAVTRLLLVCAAIFLAMKGVVTVETRLAGAPLPTFGRWVAFVLLWPGMRPHLFALRRERVRAGAGRLVLRGLATAAAGLLCLSLARALGPGEGESAALAALLALGGLGLLIHFGGFLVLAGLWRMAAVPVEPLFDAPHRARSLSEFWSRRWNVAFSEMMQIAVHRPLRVRLGGPTATMGVFLLSGLFHEMALSVPARGGYGLPTLYFALHGVLVILERRPCEPRTREARLRTAALVLLPLPLVFHPPFVAAVILPLLA